MPSPNTNKHYVSNSIYHIYNRGVDKNLIFYNFYDYITYTRFIKESIMSETDYICEVSSKKYRPSTTARRISAFENVKNFNGRIKLLLHVLMPNHFHFMIKQTGERDIQNFMKSLQTRYVKYFNRKYSRVGHLYQGRFKARRITSNDDLIGTSRYVFRNPLHLSTNLRKYPWSSFKYYAHKKPPVWISTEEILQTFENSRFRARYKCYADYVEDSHPE